MATNAGLNVAGLPEIVKALDEIGGRVATNITRRGVYAGGVVLRDEARRLVTVRTGALKKATVVKRGDPKKGFQSISYGIARVQFLMRPSGKIKKAGKTTVASRKSSGLQYISPRRYAHLVELGTTHSQPHSFILRAANNKAQAAVDAMLKSMSSSLDAEVAKLKVR